MNPPGDRRATATGPPPRRFHVLALDYDGTLADGAAPSPAVLAVLAGARAARTLVVLVTGRILAELRDAFPGVDDHVDAIVAENGGVLAAANRSRPLHEPVDPALAGDLRGHGVDVRAGEVLLACSAAHEHAVVDAVRRHGLELTVVHNRSELMVLPAGVTKGTGLAAALAGLGRSPHDTIAVGDAENDHSLLDLAEVRVAVANAVRSLRDEADVVLDGADGNGIVELWARGLIADRRRAPNPRWRIDLGVDGDGTPVTLPAAPIDVLVAGPTGAGKSYAAGLLAEQLVLLGYAVLVVDPEGDHVGLGRLPHVTVAGGDHLPDPASLLALHDHGVIGVVADLSRLDRGRQLDWLGGLPAEVEAHRRRTGMPHWIILDEAQHADGFGAGPPYDPGAKGHCRVTWHPAAVPAATALAADAILALADPAPGDDLVELVAGIAAEAPDQVRGALTGPVGGIVLARRDRPGRLSTFRPRRRWSPHFRHEHKYAVAGVDTRHGFHFRATPEVHTGAVARNLGDLQAELARCPAAVLRHHCPRGDLSRWIGDVFHDDPLAGAVAGIEATVDPTAPDGAVEGARRALVATLGARQHQPR